MHWDISLRNLMYHIKNGKIFGVLNDFDLSLLVDANNLSTSKQQTGTEPFMAIDLLVPQLPAHQYCHDSKLLFYIILWIITSYHDGKHINKPPLQERKHLGIKCFQGKKKAFLLTALPPHTENFTLVAEKWIHPMSGLFIQGFAARQAYTPEVSHPFEEATLGRHVSFDTFAQIVDRQLE
ncbi:hypothetical protein C8R44DRAFT_884805 [Mycena epipterygia]|nr:hypothetical protein C8R44DRAFT_884805 [Mycena epipterygia]